MIGDITVATNIYLLTRFTDMRRSIDGYVLLYKRLHPNVAGRFRWPRNSSEAKNITWQQFNWLMSGLDIEQPKALKIT